MERLTDPLYEAKLIYNTTSFGDTVRTFCMNPYGEVSTESYGDVVTVNGHSYAERKTPYTNFAVLVSQRFTQPFRDPIAYGRSIARLANLLGDGLDRLEIAGRGNRKARLDDIHTELRQGVRHFELFLEVHAASGRLLAIPQRRIENDDSSLRF